MASGWSFGGGGLGAALAKFAEAGVPFTNGMDFSQAGAAGTTTGLTRGQALDMVNGNIGGYLSSSDPVFQSYNQDPAGAIVGSAIPIPPPPVTPPLTGDYNFEDLDLSHLPNSSDTPENIISSILDNLNRDFGGNLANAPASPTTPVDNIPTGVPATTPPPSNGESIQDILDRIALDYPNYTPPNNPTPTQPTPTNPPTTGNSPVSQQPTFNEQLLDTLIGGIFGGGGSNGQGGSANVNISDLLGDILFGDTTSNAQGGLGGQGGNATGGNAQGGNSTAQGGSVGNTSSNSQGGAGGSVGNTSAQGGSIGDTSAQGGAGGTVGNTTSTGGTVGNTTTGASTSQGGNSSNSLSDLLSNVGNTAINLGATDYVADKQLEGNQAAIDASNRIYDDQVGRLEPFRQAGTNVIGDLLNASRGNQPFVDPRTGQVTINPTTDIQLNQQALPELNAGDRSLGDLNPNVSFDRPSVSSTSGLPQIQAGNRDVSAINPNVSLNTPDANQVDVNRINPFDINDPALKYIIDQGTRTIENSALAGGKLNSGGTLEALQELGQGAALNRAQELQSISSAQDSSNLSANNQLYGQQANNAGIDLQRQVTGFNQGQTNNQLNNQLNQQDLGNSAAVRSQLFGEGSTQFNQGAALAGIDLGAQGQEFSQGFDLNNFTNSLNQQDLTNASGVRNQLFGEDLSGANFNLGQDQYNIGNQFGLNDQNFQFNSGYNQQSQGYDLNNFNKLDSIFRAGGNAAASQGNGSGTLTNAISPLLAQQGDIKTQRANGYTNGLAGYFS